MPSRRIRQVLKKLSLVDKTILFTYLPDSIKAYKKVGQKERSIINDIKKYVDVLGSGKQRDANTSIKLAKIESHAP